jgi:hypothetical protein
MKINDILKDLIIPFTAFSVLLFSLSVYIDDNQRIDEIVISKQQVNLIKETFLNTWERNPSDNEMRAIIKKHIDTKIREYEDLPMESDKENTRLLLNGKLVR